MARKILRHDTPEKADLRISDDRRDELSRWLSTEIFNAVAAKKTIEATWQELLRQYNGDPIRKRRDVPIANAPTTEITIGAIAADSIFAQAMDLKWVQTSPLVSVRPTSGRGGPDAARKAKALEQFANHIAVFEANAEDADECASLDAIQLGTGVFYIPWVERRKKTRVATVLSRGPIILPIPVEDFLTPAGAVGDIEDLQWVAIRFVLTEAELVERAQVNGWIGIDQARPQGADNWMKKKRAYYAHQQSSDTLQSLYDVYDIYCYYDIDGDGVREDLYVVFNATAGTILRIAYNPFDSRPIVLMRYQRRPHLIYGLGVLEMMRPYENEVTDIHNERILNMIIANCRHWVGREGVIPEDLVFFPNSVTTVPNPRDDLIPLPMGDVYPSSVQAETLTTMLAERRVGVNEMSMPRPSSIMGSRTPGITALSLLQQVNRRFTPAFDALRKGLGEAVRQCILRYRERLLAKDRDVEDQIFDIMGVEDAIHLKELLLDDHFDEAYSMELTASSVSINREADRQNAVMLTNLLGQYYEKAIQLLLLASNPNIPQGVRSVAVKIAEKANEVMDRTIRTFEMVRDPATFIIDFDEEIQEIASQSLQPPVGGLTGPGLSTPFGPGAGGNPPPTGEVPPGEPGI
jgi:hypothetical protein